MTTDWETGRDLARRFKKAAASEEGGDAEFETGWALAEWIEENYPKPLTVPERVVLTIDNDAHPLSHSQPWAMTRRVNGVMEGMTFGVSPEAVMADYFDEFGRGDPLDED